MQAEKRKTGTGCIQSLSVVDMKSVKCFFYVCFWWCVFLCDCGYDSLCGESEFSPWFCSALSSNSTKLFSEESSTIAVPQRPVFNHWTLCVNITLIYWTKPYEVWASTFIFLNKCFPLRGSQTDKTEDLDKFRPKIRSVSLECRFVNATSVFRIVLQHVHDYGETVE